jgi:raffinose/stachyose/melibiose transport system substrate-binding protein
MNMKRRMFLLFALCVILVSGPGELWAGGGKGEEKTAGRIPLTIWNLADRRGGMDPLIQEFRAKNPDIEVTAAYYSTDGIKDACKVAASSRTLPEMWFNWGGNLGGFYVENGLTYDLTAYAKANDWEKIFSPAVLSLSTLHGKLSGYPINLSTLGMFYRKDIFDKYNLKIPATFAEFEQLCAALKRNGITPCSTAGLYGWHAMRYLEQFIEHYAGPELHDKIDAFQVSFDNDAVVQALAKFKEFSDKGYFPEGFISADPNGTYIPVFSGSAAMDLQTQSYDGRILRENQDMNKFGVFALPNGGSNRMSAFAQMIQLNANLSSDKLAACMKFLNFLYSGDSVSRYGAHFTLPLPRLDAEMPSGQIHIPELRNFAARNGTFTITDQAFPTEVADALFRVQEGLINGQISPKEGAGRVQAAIEAYLKK